MSWAAVDIPATCALEKWHGACSLAMTSFKMGRRVPHHLDALAVPRWSGAAVAVTALLALGCGDDGVSKSTWEPVFDADAISYQSSVWGSGADDVFIVGGTADSAEIHHFDGAEWSSMTPPAGATLLVWVFGFGPDDVYSVGTDGTFIHYDGAIWSALDAGTGEDLWGIWGQSPDDLWIVGGNIASGDPLLLHYDGSAVTDVGVPADQNPVGAKALFKVWGTGSKLFAVGQNGLIVEHTGDTWTRRSAGENADEDFVSLWGTSERDIVVVGGRSGSRIAVYDGATFDTRKPAGVAGTSAVFATSDAIWIGGGEPGFVGTYDPIDDRVTIDTATLYGIHSLWADDQGNVYAVGGVPAEPYPGVALVRRP